MNHLTYEMNEEEQCSSTSNKYWRPCNRNKTV